VTFFFGDDDYDDDYKAFLVAAGVGPRQVIDIANKMV
jgi:hypothetical protein